MPEVGEFHLRVLMRISALIGEVDQPVTMFVTSTHFGKIAEEARALKRPGLADPSPQNFKELRIGHNLIVVNSGSEDQAAVNIANRAEAERVNFAGRRDILRTG